MTFKPTMMKKLYIPTSSLNFNNILSSESISPRSFYERRGFGYRRWTTIPENENENVILLYETPFSFERPISDVEDHPMMIEITTDEDFPLANASGVRYSDHTIYLDPWNTKFIFFEEKDKRVALSLSDNSLETKMLPLYSKNGICLGHYEKLRIPSVTLQQPLCVSGLEKDKQLNKMKGLLYGYYIGANLSSSKETALQYRILMELNNLVAYIISSGNEIYSSESKAKISDSVKQMQQEIEVYDKRTHKLLNPDSGEVHVVEGVLNSISILPDKQENKLLIKLVNNVWIAGKLSSIKDDVSDQIAKIARELYGDAWENSVIRQQLNAIRRYVRGQEAEVDWNNTLIASIASVLLRGDEWDKMLSFMRRKGMSDYRVAFALYGAFTGFANMTRDFTDLLLTLDSKYVAEVYTEFYGQLHGTPVNTAVSVDEYPSAHSPVTKALANEGRMQEAANKTSVETLSGIVMAAFDKMSYRGKDKLLEPLKRCLEEAGEDATVSQFLHILGEKYKNEGWKKSNKAYKRLEKILLEDSQNEELKMHDDKKPFVQQNLFEVTKSGVQSFEDSVSSGKNLMPKSIIDDDSAKSLILGCDELGILKQQIVQIFEAFQRSYRNGYYYNHRDQYRRNNEDVVGHFCKWIFSEKNSQHIDWSHENKDKVDALKKKLLEVYHD